MPKTTSPRALLFAGALALSAPAAQAADWLLASSSPQVVPGQRFEVVVIGDGRSADWPPRLPASIEQSGRFAKIHAIGAVGREIGSGKVKLR